MIKQSAVILLHELTTDSLVLTKRASHLREHPGEFCFPGGGWELKDKNLWNTALRELHEELGIQSNRVKFIKKLNIESTLIGKIIHPWLAFISTITPFKINMAEVSSVIRLPMNAVTLSDNYQNILVERQGKSFTSCQFTATDQLIWGATARIMQQLTIN